VNPLTRGLIEMLGVVGAIVGIGLVGQGVGASVTDPHPEPEGIGAPAADPYAGEMERTQRAVWLVDGYNVLCSGVLGGRERSRWWSEERRQELLARLEGFDDPEAEIWVVFDGENPPPADPVEAGRIHAVFAPSADDWLVDEVKRQVAEARTVSVVTADRKVAGRSRHRGAQVIAPRELLGRCLG
jgi:predicted RNA-binding protein with PIN domain